MVFFFKGEKIHAEDIKEILENMGIEMTNKENKKLLKTLPVCGKLCVLFSLIPKKMYSFDKH